MLQLNEIFMIFEGDVIKTVSLRKRLLCFMGDFSILCLTTDVSIKVM
jgi:hypothetical protein